MDIDGSAEGDRLSGVQVQSGRKVVHAGDIGKSRVAYNQSSDFLKMV